MGRTNSTQRQISFSRSNPYDGGSGSSCRRRRRRRRHDDQRFHDFESTKELNSYGARWCGVAATDGRRRVEPDTSIVSQTHALQKPALLVDQQRTSRGKMRRKGIRRSSVQALLQPAQPLAKTKGTVPAMVNANRPAII